MPPSYCSGGEFLFERQRCDARADADIQASGAHPERGAPLAHDPARFPSIWSVRDIGREIETQDPDAVIRSPRATTHASTSVRCSCATWFWVSRLWDACILREMQVY
jgi:hypothetical protein